MPTSIHGTNGITFNDGSTQNTRAPSAFKNKIINGDMRIWQRGTTISNPLSTNFYTADRWGCNRAGDVSGAVVSRISSGLTGFQYALSLQRVAGNTSIDALSLWYSAESSDVYDLAGSPVTLSFWAKTGTTYSGGSTVAFIIYSGTGTDQRVYSFTGSVSVASTTQAISSAWTRYTLTGTVPSNSTQLGLQINWVPTGTAGADDSVKIVGIQLEAGSTATEFERRPIGTELALCQRYYWKVATNVGRAVDASNTHQPAIYMRQTMRTAPTLESGATFTVGGGSAGSPIILSGTGANPSPDTVYLYNSSANWTVGQPVQLNGAFYAEL